MSLYGQDPELQLVSAFLPLLQRRSVIDAGAERGSVSAALLAAGASHVHAFEPDPRNAEALRRRLGLDERVEIHECAVSDSDRVVELHLSTAPDDGSPITYGHTLLDRQDTPEIAWNDTITVPGRSIASLIAAGELPSCVGLLKVDTEGHDLAVVRGMGPLQCDVVMVEHGAELPSGLGACPWDAEEMVGTLRGRGFCHFAFVIHRGEFVTLKWDDADVITGEMGNLIFVHDSVLEKLMPEVLRCAAALSEDAVNVGRMYRTAALERQHVIEELKDAADARLSALEAMSAAPPRRPEELEPRPGHRPRHSGNAIT